jgi:serine/threonine protein phosphatase 1
MAGRTIAIGDIHGCATALAALLKAIEPEADDTIITLGDYVDRGPDSAGVIEILSDLLGRCHLVPLLGNHEIMMLQAAGGKNRRFWLECGGDTTLSSYGGKFGNVPQHHRIFFDNCQRFYETETEFFIHANYDYQSPLNEQLDEVIFWQHVSYQPPPPHMNGKRAIVGHTPQIDGEIQFFEHLVLLDTYCFGGMWLSALDVESGKFWQTNELGELRSD